MGFWLHLRVLKRAVGLSCVWQGNLGFLLFSLDLYSSDFTWIGQCHKFGTLFIQILASNNKSIEQVYFIVEIFTDTVCIPQKLLKKTKTILTIISKMWGKY